LADFQQFDLVLAMDQDQYSHLRYVCPPGLEARLALLMRYAGQTSVRDVVDPYRRRRRVFEQAWRDINAGCRGLLENLRAPGE
jgi:protein-tyrosine phosphatase